MSKTTELIAHVDRCGGAAVVTSLFAEGFTRHEVRAALATGALERPRRGWVVTGGADSALRRAVAVGGRITCVSAAERLGLWVREHDELHLSVAANASRFDRDGLRVHWGAAPMPTAADAVLDPIVNVLFHVAACLVRWEALAIWESALRRGLVDEAVLARIEWGAVAAREMAARAGYLSDSGIETRFIELMRRLAVDVQQQVWLDGHPVDGLIGRRLVVQIDGFAHHQAGDRRRDLAADARLALRGYTVLRFDYYQLLFQADQVIDTVAMAMAQGLHR
ncbi:endonuclease domain-containing protein [Microbacterium binotii]|uniref:endonuclease domain-containing protein n=1 Tax=Microbacterium binotii TaxID=462710 RepID=UPI001F3FF02B|nr:DUF559 domain-containing protein [Microbacterium binotii]UIN29709.1 endonuclease domain-containing protein [Microbacterium binotii]